MNESGRSLIGKYTSLTSRDALYEAADSFEIETRSGYEIVERRVLYDDVMFVTHHRHHGAAYLITTGSVALFFLALVLIIMFAIPGAWPAAVFVGILGLPALIGFLMRAFIGVFTVTIYGRRSKAAIRFRLRRERAQEAYERICAIVRNAQSSAAPPSEPPPSSAAEDRADHVAGTLPV
ncbi:MAG TPA: hypothetical protein VF846_09180 [Thermoanaerobaculia bacterium]|jgi:hypothetical protein